MNFSNMMEVLLYFAKLGYSDILNLILYSLEQVSSRI